MTRIVTLLLLSILAALPLAGCAADDLPDLDPAAVARAAERTARVESGRAVVRASTAMPGVGTMPFTMTGVFDSREQSGRFDFNVDHLPAALQGSGLDADDLSGKIILDDLQLYMRMPILERALPEGKRWMRMDLRQAGKQMGIDIEQLAELCRSPVDQVRYLQGVTDELRPIGEEEVAGEQTTHYRATVNLRRVPGQVPRDQRARMRRSIDALIKLTGTARQPVEVWIGEDGLVRRQRHRQTIVQGGQKITTTMDMILYDFGVDVDVEKPAGKRVVDALELAEAEGQAG